MKLYLMEIMVLNLKKQVETRFPLTIEGGNPGSDNGDWSVRAPGSAYLGQADGWWKTFRDDDGLLEIWLMEDEDPNMVSWLWRTLPNNVCVLEGILKFPLFLGETGTGITTVVGGRSYLLGWKVTRGMH